MLPANGLTAGAEDGRERAGKDMGRKGLLLFGILAFFLLLSGTASAGFVQIPAGTQVIGEEAFFGDLTLDHVALPEGLKRIESKAFAYSSVKLINLPSTLEYIADDAFYGCTGIEINGVRGDNHAYKWGRSHGYCRRFVALLIGEAEFYGYDEQGRWTRVDWADRNVGDVLRMSEMLNRVYTPNLTAFEVFQVQDRSYEEVHDDIQAAFSDTMPQDVCWFFIATHGDSDGDGDLSLVDNTFLSFTTLASWLKAATPAPVVVILESCGAGSAILGNGADAEDEEAMRNFTRRAISAFAAADTGTAFSNSTGDMRIKGKFYVLAAAAHHQLSWGFESDKAHDYENSSNYFTCWLLEGIGHAWNAPGDISPRDGTLTLNEVFRYVQKYNTYQISSEGEYYSQYVQCYPEGSDYRLVRHY